jgi:uncharacterized protein (UPF0335 family)
MVGYARLGLPAIEGRSAMKTEKAIQVLRDFNLWRRGDEEMEQPDQYTIGEAIDDVLMAIDNMEEEIDAAIEAIDNMEEESKKLRQELIEMAVYADKLAAGFPEGMLPKDMEVLREANLGLATEVTAVTEQRDRWRRQALRERDENIKREEREKSLERELAAVTEQRDRLAEAIRKHRDELKLTSGDSVDRILWNTLEAVEGGSDD